MINPERFFLPPPRDGSDFKELFHRLARQQAPKYFWIGCSDSRVPANEIIDLAPGEVFVHRNVANVLPQSDLNALSTLQFAVDILRVEHVLVVGHYGCSGVKTVLDNRRVGLADNWLGHVREVMDNHAAQLGALGDDAARFERLCELNALEQAPNVCRTTVMQDAGTRGQRVTVHACVYGLKDGLLRDLNYSVNRLAGVYSQFHQALKTLDA
ncbi:carbonic anhydrase 2 [mine drainage metagenome]|uniref:carbonic anhydrase n=1 Tax=mine drainage metagenome TaxID=410659 RepID=A0A1J5PFM1_9ZZZZ